jgi:thymidylate kinase
MVLLVIEGIERSGKSTLCQRLSKSLGWPLFDWSDEFDKVRKMLDYRSRINFAFAITYTVMRKVDWSKQNMIFQRFWTSNEVYSKVLGDTDEVKTTIKNYNPVIDFPNTILIWLDTPVNIVEVRMEQLGESFSGARHLQLMQLKDEFHANLYRYVENGGQYYTINGIMNPEQLEEETRWILNSHALLPMIK